MRWSTTSLERSRLFGPLLVALLVSFVASCGKTVQEMPSTPSGLQSKPLASRSASATGPLFTKLPAEESGIEFVNPLIADHPLRRLYAGGYAVGGIAIGDVNGDALPDIYCVSGPEPNKLFIQQDNLSFVDRTAQSGLTDGGDDWETGAAMADIDGDGDLDLYVCRYDAPNALFINDGAGNFQERAADFGVDVSQASLMPSFADYDNDGDLDLYILTNLYYRENGLPLDATFMAGNELKVKSEYRQWVDIRPAGMGMMHKRYELYPVGQRDVLLRNDGANASGDLTFKDVSGYAGDIGVHPGKGLSAAWWDYNEDGYPDLYVCNDFEDSDRFYHNNGDGTFTDIIKASVPHTPWYSMGSDVADFDQDGRLDLLALDMAATSHFKQKTTMGDMSSKQHFMATAEPRQYMRNSLFLNTGTPRFQEAAHMAGLASSDWSWAAKAGDFDNDGLVDVFVSNGMARAFTNSDILRDITYNMRFGKTDWELFEDKPPQKEANLVFRNRGNLDFSETGVAWGLSHEGMSYSAAYGDLDRDGDLDLLVANLDEPVHLYRNDSNEGHRLLIELRGTRSHVSAFGARVVAQAGDRTFVRSMNPHTGFLSSNDPVIHLSTGDISHLDKLTVYWPSRIVQEFDDVPMDRWLIIEESGAPPSSPGSSAQESTNTLFTRLAAPLGLRHEERHYDDFYRQPLLPNKLSQLGPGLAVADVDGNGWEDLYLGGAAGFSGQLLLRHPNGKTDIVSAPFIQDKDHEDMAPLFFDANGDGHVDLYVASGGVECEPGAYILRDRLYLGDGSGGFTQAIDALPDLRDSAAAAAAADFDRDGDVDVFVGGRSIPGSYPLSPTNRLLINRGGSFESQPETAVASTGLVTSALWSDVDGDSWLDLLLAHEWGPIKVFLNREGRLEESRDTGIDHLTGWWNSITPGDVDRDGDMDYAVMNAGLNTKYHASADQPALLYYGDFEGDGRMHLVEAEFENETLFPMRGRSCSSHAMPHLKDKFPSYQGFALASLSEVFPQSALDSSHRFAATTLESGVLLNDGVGRFTFQPLPRIAQIAPAYGVSLTDFDGDGELDLYMLQNFFGPQLETGRMNGGVSQLLLGQGDGRFVPVSPSQSGLVIPGDGTALVVMDLNQDQAPDIVAAQNDGQVVAFTNRNTGQRTWHTIELHDKDRSLAGTRVQIRSGDRLMLTREISAGSGYLSQSTSTIYFTLPQNESATASIAWPDGTTSKVILSGKTSRNRVNRPSQ